MSFDIEFQFDWGTFLGFVLSVLMALTYWSRVRKEQRLSATTKAAIGKIINARTNSNNVLISLKRGHEPPDTDDAQFQDKLHEYSRFLWECCENLKSEAEWITIFSTSISSTKFHGSGDAIVDGIDKAYETWRSGLENHSIEMKAINQVKLLAFELTILSDLLLAHAAMPKRTFKRFLAARESKWESYRSSFRDLI